MVDCADDAQAGTPFTVHMAPHPSSGPVFLALAPRLLDDLVAAEMTAEGIDVVRGGGAASVADARYHVAVISGHAPPCTATAVVVRLGEQVAFGDARVVVSSVAGELRFSLTDLHALVALVSHLCASADT